VAGPRAVIREARSGHRTVDLLLYDDVLAVVPRSAWYGEPGDPAGWVIGGAFGLFGGPWLRRRRDRREAARRWPRRTRVVPLASVGSVLVRPGPYGAATLAVDGVTYEIPQATAYRAPWDELLGPLFGDRMRVE
jgi:hypothetical protein